MKEIDLRSLTSEELNRLLSDIHDEQERREDEEKEKWSNKLAIVIQEIYDAGYFIIVDESAELRTDNFILYD